MTKSKHQTPEVKMKEIDEVIRKILSVPYSTRSAREHKKLKSKQNYKRRLAKRE